MTLTPDNAFILLEAPQSQLRDNLRKRWLAEQTSEELILWAGLCAYQLGLRHGARKGGDLLATLGADLANEMAAQEQAGTS